jgi:hypothetical protein
VFARLLLVASLLVAAVPARADVVLRGNYWRDRNTRVLSPEGILIKELPTGTTVGASYLLDAITSASAAAGGSSDKPFTELRNEFGAILGQRYKFVNILARYSYSTESDYWAHTATLGSVFDLFQHNTQLALSVTYGHDTVGQRQATGFIVRGGLDRVHIIAGWTQTILPTLLFDLSLDLGQNGFGSPDNGFQANPYRLVKVAGSPQREQVPFERHKLAATAAFHWVIPTGGGLVPYIGFRPSIRYYTDDWGVHGVTGELRTYLPIGPVELRVSGRIYKQWQASFYSNEIDPTAPNPDTPMYSNSGLNCPTCFSAKIKNGPYFTSDPKLSEFNDYFVDFRLLVKLRFLKKLGPWISSGTFELSYGVWFPNNYARGAYFDYGQMVGAHVGGIGLAFPL